MSFVGFKNLELEAAKVASRDPSFKAQALKAKHAVDSEVDRAYATAEPGATGRFKASIGIETVRTARGVLDIDVYTTDEEANIIELGHITKNGTWVPGKFVFARALAKFGG